MTRQQRQRQSLRVREKSTCGRENAKCRKKDGGYLSLKETQPSKLNLQISTHTHTQSRLGDGMGDWERHREREGTVEEWELRVGLVGGQEGRKEGRKRQAGRQAGEVGRYWQGVAFDDLFHAFCGQVAAPESRCRLLPPSSQWSPSPLLLTAFTLPWNATTPAAHLGPPVSH